MEPRIQMHWNAHPQYPGDLPMGHHVFLTLVVTNAQALNIIIRSQ